MSTDLIKTCLQSNGTDLAKIYGNKSTKENIMTMTRFGVESLHKLETLSDAECHQLENIAQLIIQLIHNTRIYRDEIIAFFEHFSQYDDKSRSLNGCIAKHLKTMKSRTLIKVLSRWLDVLSHYQWVIGDQGNQDDEILQEILQQLDKPLNHLPYMGSCFFYLGSIHQRSNGMINESCSKQCRQYIILSAKDLENWSSNTLHGVMGIVIALPFDNSEDYVQTLLTIAAHGKLQKSLLRTCTNDETLLIHAITEHFVRAIDRGRIAATIIEKAEESLKILHKNAKYHLTKANICYLLFRITSKSEHISDSMLIEYFECISQLKWLMKNTIKLRKKRIQLIQGIDMACRIDWIKQRVIRLKQRKTNLFTDDHLQQWINHLTPSSLEPPLPTERRNSPSRSQILQPPTGDQPLLGRSMEYRRTKFEIEKKFDIVIDSAPTSLPLPVKNYLTMQGYSVLIFDESIDSQTTEKFILCSKSLIIYFDNDDYDQHRAAMILAYKNQVPMILMLDDDRKKLQSDDYFLQFIFEQCLALSSVVVTKDFNSAMDQLINVIKNPREINKLGVRQRISSAGFASMIEDLYKACQNNDIDQVQHYLRQMNIENINHITSSGSTALHVAAYKGHNEIVRLLLDAGASTTIRNRPYNMTPYEEASKPSTKCLFHLHKSKASFSPFINNDLRTEWTCTYQNPTKKRRQLREKLKQLLFVKDYRYDEIFKDIRKSVSVALNDSALSPQYIDKAKEYFNRLKRELDPTHFIKCYSSTTSFHRFINEYLAKNGLEFFDFNLVNLNTDYRAVKSFLQLVALLIHHDRFSQLKFRGKTYRGLVMTDDDLQKYIVGSQVLNSSFLSTSKEDDIARLFRGHGQETNLRITHDKKPLQHSVMCIYNIKNADTALDIETISERKWDEREVLILPFSVFKVVDRRVLPDFVEIILDEIADEIVTV